MTLTQHYPPYLCSDPPLFQFTASNTTWSCFNKVSQGSSPWTIYSDDGGPVDSITPHEASPNGFWLLLWFTSVSLMDVHTVRSPKRNRKAVKRPPSSSHSSTILDTTATGIEPHLFNILYPCGDVLTRKLDSISSVRTCRPQQVF